MLAAAEALPAIGIHLQTWILVPGMEKAPHLVLSVQFQPKTAGHLAAIQFFQSSKSVATLSPPCSARSPPPPPVSPGTVSHGADAGDQLLLICRQKIAVHVVAQDRNTPPPLCVNLQSDLPLLPAGQTAQVPKVEAILRPVQQQGGNSSLSTFPGFCAIVCGGKGGYLLSCPRFHRPSRCATSGAGILLCSFAVHWFTSFCAFTHSLCFCETYST